MKVGIFGAGAIGASLGIRLSAANVPVRMLARASLCNVAARLSVRMLDGSTFTPGDDLVLDEDPAILRDVDICLVTVKSKDTTAAAETLADILDPSAVVVSFQNGLRNPARLRAVLPNPVCGGMVSYNVVRPEPGAFRQATKGPLIAAEHPKLLELGRALEKTGDGLTLRSDIEDVMAGKLLINLNNGICAVTGVTIAESVRNRTLRRCFSALMREGLDVMATAGMHPRSIVGVPPWIIARMLPLPNFIVLRVAKSMVAIDPSAKSSTLQDLEAGKPTEIDDICGEVTHLAENNSTRAPANALIVNAVHDLEAQDDKRFWSAEGLYSALRSTG